MSREGTVRTIAGDIGFYDPVSNTRRSAEGYRLAWLSDFSSAERFSVFKRMDDQGGHWNALRVWNMAKHFLTATEAWYQIAYQAHRADPSDVQKRNKFIKISQQMAIYRFLASHGGTALRTYIVKWYAANKAALARHSVVAQRIRSGAYSHYQPNLPPFREQMPSL